MKCSFTAYIDEAGDEGFKFLPEEKGSSRWFVISAVVFRQSAALTPVEIMKQARVRLGKPEKHVLHFRELRHEQRIAYVDQIAGRPLRTVSIAVHKPSIPEPERYQSGKYLLYKYAVRLLLERASWLCRDTKKDGEGDGTIDLVFSDRSAMSYESLRDYLRLLRTQAEANDRIRIEWSSLDPDKVRAVAHDKLAGLQVADAVASSVFYALNVSQYGMVEPRYSEMLRGNVYRHRGRRIGYGMKFWPDHTPLKEQMPHLAAFDDW
jgi:hypothetical protein